MSEPEIADHNSLQDSPVIADSEQVRASVMPAFDQNVRPIDFRKIAAGLFWCSLLFALTGFLIGLRTAAIATLPHILLPGEAVAFQEVIPGLPVQRHLNWDFDFINFLISLRDLSGVTLVFAQILVFGILWLIAVCILNPTFRPLQLSSSAITVDTHCLFKAVKVFLIIGIPVLVVWLVFHEHNPPIVNDSLIALDAAVKPWNRIWAVRLISLGIALWIGFHQQGLAGDFRSAQLNVSPRLFPKLAFEGALFGLVVFMSGRYAVPGTLEPTLTRYQALGAIDTISWNEVAGIYIVCMVFTWFAGGSLYYIMARPGIKTSLRAILLFIPLLSLCGAVLAQRPLANRNQAARLDLTREVLHAIPSAYTPLRGGTGLPDGPPAAAILAHKIHIQAETHLDQPGRSAVVFYPASFGNGSVRNVRLNDYTIDGLSATQDSAVEVAKFLRSRHYRSALSWVALKHIFNVNTIRFDTTGALTALIDDLAHGSHLTRDGYTAETMLFTCAASSENLAQLDRWADPALFDFPDRKSKRFIGDLYRRFGKVDKALSWYRKADMPRSFLKRVETEKPMFHTGRIVGVLHLNGRPLVNMQVGLVPCRMNGLPSFLLEKMVADSIHEIDSGATEPPFRPYHPTAYALRWISAAATTDSNGVFAIDHLVEGEYRMICTLPSDVHLIPPFDSNLIVQNQPGALVVNYKHPVLSLDAIELRTNRSNTTGNRNDANSVPDPFASSP